MTDAPPPGWRPLSTGSRRRVNVDWAAAFPRLAVCHMLSVSGETLVVLSLAGSVFFKVDPSQGREKVILGLLFTMAPFALVGPFIGPVIDRAPGGHRAVIRATMVLRVLVALAMTVAAVQDSLALFVEAFAMLVLAKTYQIARAAVVPSTVAGDLELVEANSKLQVLSGLAAIVSGAIGAVLLQIGPAWVLGFTTVVFAAATVASQRLHPSPAGAQEELDVRAADESGVPDLEVPGDLAVAAFSMASLRFVVGFLTFLLAFELRGDEGVTPLARAVFTVLTVHKRFVRAGTVVTPLEGAPPSWYFGAVIAASVAGGLIGAVAAPPLRRRLSEERMLVGAALLATLASIVAVVVDGVAGYTLLALGIATAAALGKQAFDAVVQRDIEDRDRGRLFARFESRFQMTWVLGALVPSVVPIPVSAGAVLLAVVAALAAASLFSGRRPAFAKVPGATGWRRIGRPYVSRSGKSGMSGSSSSSGSG